MSLSHLVKYKSIGMVADPGYYHEASVFDENFSYK